VGHTPERDAGTHLVGRCLGHRVGLDISNSSKGEEIYPLLQNIQIGYILYIYIRIYTVEPLITDTAGEFKFCPLVGVRQALMEAIRGIGFSFFIGGVR
jgi:hypothetical protein